MSLSYLEILKQNMKDAHHEEVVMVNYEALTKFHAEYDRLNKAGEEQRNLEVDEDRDSFGDDKITVNYQVMDKLLKDFEKMYENRYIHINRANKYKQP